MPTSGEEGGSEPQPGELEPEAGAPSQADPITKDYVDEVFGGENDAETVAPVAAPTLKTSFKPWHHPVKQIVRDYQWADHVRRLLRDWRKSQDRGTLRYFTLPGPDLLDVRMLAKSLESLGTSIEYFGFDTDYGGGDNPAESAGVYLSTESALRQAGRITDDAEILSDRLEDIAVSGSQAANRLRKRGVFDVVNIDACDHLGYKPAHREKSIFDALEKLLAHQLTATQPWLLLITTRANTQLLGGPMIKVIGSVQKNLDEHGDGFGGPLADCIGGSTITLTSDLMGHWSTQSLTFLKLFSVALGKYLLQFYHAQRNLPADVQLVSAFAYKVSTDQPDMLSLAFRIIPQGVCAQPPSAGGAQVIPPIELDRAVSIVQKAMTLWDLDNAIANDDGVKNDAVVGTEELLASASYDLQAWREWLRNLPVRPMELDDAA
jgi:hypothetical protein